MTFTANFYARMLGAIGLSYAGYSFAQANSSTPATDAQRWAAGLLMLCGAALGLIVTPYLTIAPMRRLIAIIQVTPFSEVLSIIFGIIAGLIAGVLVTFPLSNLPGALGNYSPLVAAILLAYIGAAIATARRPEIVSLIRRVSRAGAEEGANALLVDTSIIVDGRIAQLVDTGFVDQPLMIPRFVLHELQHLADSPHDLTRAKGKRGLEVLRSLQDNERVDVMIAPVDAAGDHEVDSRLVSLALSQTIPLLTNDSNLGRIAELQGVRVLNLNRLAESLRTQYAVGDRVRITVRSEGREREQGVGFASDGTMIVVEDARRLIGHEVSAVVTRVYTTQNGRIIFAQLDRSNGAAVEPVARP